MPNAVQDRSAHTIAAYQNDVASFLAWLEAHLHSTTNSYSRSVLGNADSTLWFPHCYTPQNHQ